MNYNFGLGRTPMEHHRARTIQTHNPSEIGVEIFEEGKETLVEVLREPIPDGFPPALVHHLADMWARGFNTAIVRGCHPHEDSDSGTDGIDLREFAPLLSGRPVNPEVAARGRKAAALREKCLTYGEIALQLCPERTERHHRCGGKKCADRIRQEANEYLNRKAIADLQKED
jgi:hypothetical protein